MTRGALFAAAACLPLLLALDAAGQGTPAPGGEQAIYRYVNAKGRPVFVNDRTRIPRRHRDKARPVDLSAVSLNKELATEIEEQVKRYEERKEAREAARKETREEARGSKREARGRPVLRLHQTPAPRGGALGWIERLWRDYDYLVVIAGALLLLLAFTPYMVRRIDPDRWVRVLMFVLPVLASLGIMTYAMTRTAQLGAELAASVPDLSPGEVARDDKEDGEFTTDSDGWVTRRESVKASVEEPAPGTVRGLRRLLQQLQQLEEQRERVLKEAR